MQLMWESSLFSSPLEWEYWLKFSGFRQPRNLCPINWILVSRLFTHTDKSTHNMNHWRMIMPLPRDESNMLECKMLFILQLAHVHFMEQRISDVKLDSVFISSSLKNRWKFLGFSCVFLPFCMQDVLLFHTVPSCWICVRVSLSWFPGSYSQPLFMNFLKVYLKYELIRGSL